MVDLAVKIVDYLISQGSLGVIVVLLCAWNWTLQKRFDSVQEKRVGDAFKIAGQLNTFSSALDRNTETMKALVED